MFFVLLFFAVSGPTIVLRLACASGWRSSLVRQRLIGRMSGWLWSFGVAVLLGAVRILAPTQSATTLLLYFGLGG